jgi:hypothetical protein
MKSRVSKIIPTALITMSVILGVHHFIKSADTTKLVPLNVELPEPMFVGTKENILVDNVEPVRTQARPPFLAPVGTHNVALGKSVSSTDEEPIIGEIELITDGDKEAIDGSFVELGPSLQHVTIDLEDKYEIYAIAVSRSTSGQAAARISRHGCTGCRRS